ncbi:hypothetical protein SPOG_02381 [Schizosaccharomyces cryophilus OY26]|uniref:Uncharacterized protein n=1 Tax=Schizosaccharomyces cryophilus (strain OY26 / ATCC MYA-4695 / CBS 11777 / NBRC 106824 / NRRL Y48691) TaxID=653667 RepID=S9VY83_SCHCR|nr:uncharacterized protein SPOG_02381 [Schizosaccharomyces cryophilus OY26]EPY51204.1 hypothetical protein SPOG_02381 [Schizosaccharomyces cryophilus OY26]
MPVTYREALLQTNDNWGKIKLCLKVLIGLIALDYALLAYMYNESSITEGTNLLWTLLSVFSICISNSNANRVEEGALFERSLGINA